MFCNLHDLQMADQSRCCEEAVEPRAEQKAGEEDWRGAVKDETSDLQIDSGTVSKTILGIYVSIYLGPSFAGRLEGVKLD